MYIQIHTNVAWTSRRARLSQKQPAFEHCLWQPRLQNITVYSIIKMYGVMCVGHADEWNSKCTDELMHESKDGAAKETAGDRVNARASCQLQLAS